MHFLNLKTPEKNAIIFDIRNVDISLVNSIRRIILTDIPSVGFYFKLKDHFVENDINIEVNDSPLHNEFLAHRLSLVPLHFTKNEIENWKDSDYTFILNKKNKTGQIMNVTTEDFVILNNKTNEKMPESFINRIFPKDDITKDHILLTKLKPNFESLEKGTEIKLTCIARKGTAKNCICWNSISQCSYFNTLDNSAITKALKEKTKGLSNSNVKEFEKEFDTLDKYKYFLKNKYGEPDQVTFSLEVESEMSPYEVFDIGCNVIITHIENLIVEFAKGDDSSIVEVSTISDMPNFYTVMFRGFTHTIGNLVQSFIMNHYVRDKELKDQYDVSYAGYCVPHPLEEMFLLKLKFDNEISKRQLNEFLIKSFTSIKAELFSLNNEWNTFVSK
jgi:DNA-directed RNA polymerase subunit L|uniref:DNA-directed RNA polymerase RpoA/D/Rpb3-type domain-containing protein n=1 Tax=viral metagenome TaxID=1070528 RepID=A0A6C0BSE0_9ZZZZ